MYFQNDISLKVSSLYTLFSSVNIYVCQEWVYYDYANIVIRCRVRNWTLLQIPYTDNVEFQS